MASAAGMPMPVAHAPSALRSVAPRCDGVDATARRCRCEYFVFSLFAEMMPEKRDVKMYAVKNDGALLHYPKATGLVAKSMPSEGEVTNPADREDIRKLEDKMIEGYGGALIRKACEAAPKVDLSNQMLREAHVKVMGELLVTHSVTDLDISKNQLGAYGALALVDALEGNTTLLTLSCALPSFEPACFPASVPQHTLSPRLQDSWQQARPKGCNVSRSCDQE